ncbi:MAG: HNH endonuclease signature motif containing protein, partial [Deltaproteobacteria bacterium]|nr:HNH endonuclease signature motif containing protein [Deltaproteobacteria bacterium]
EQVPASAEGGESTTAQRRADALGLVAESALAGGLDPGNSADRFQVTVHVQAATLAAREARRGCAETRTAGPAAATPSPAAEDAVPHVAAETRDHGVCPDASTMPSVAKDPSTLGPATAATAHVSAEVLQASAVASEWAVPNTDLDAGLAVIEQVGGLHLGRETARRVGCDAGVVVLSHGADGEVLDVGRRTRTVPSALRRALHSRDRGQCQFPGCESRRCDAHHVEHWADGGATKLQNLLSLCRFHHRAVHEAGFRVSGGDADGQFRFLRPDGEPLPAEPPVPSWAGAPLAPIDARLAAAGISIGPDTATPEWYGESLDLTAALDVLWEPPAAAACESS